MDLLIGERPSLPQSYVVSAYAVWPRERFASASQIRMRVSLASSGLFPGESQEL
jgi:ethanolamine ammonia-lyase small subunit